MTQIVANVTQNPLHCQKICYARVSLAGRANRKRNESQTMKTASWIIVNKATAAAVFETFNENTARAVNVKLYEAIPALQYLQQLNRSIKEQSK